uniref:Uncharacterized protein n=1 Tax=Anas zonorhyncha TaxID=75864 RepID=A0A8C0A0W9_9AVES
MPALEKTNGATAVFNTGIFQYQQALANMQLQQHTAFLPPGREERGAPCGQVHQWHCSCPSGCLPQAVDSGQLARRVAQGLKSS